MNFKASLTGIFSLLSVVFWLVNHDLQSHTLVCVFYSFYTGFTWSSISRISGEDDLGWRHVLSPMLLVMIMMTAGSLKMAHSAETVMLTAIALIHMRAAVFSFNRFNGVELVFSCLQFFSFLFVIFYLFQSFVVSFLIRSNVFYMILLGMATLSMCLLIQFKRKWNASHRKETVEFSTSDS